MGNDSSLLSKIKHFVLTIQKFFQGIGNKESTMTTGSAVEILNLAQAGDILVAYERGRPTSAFIKGEYKHAAMISDLMTVVDAIGDYYIDKKNYGGVRESDLLRWLYQMDKVALIRPNAPQYIRTAAGKSARTFIGIAYDYIFNYGSEKIYCSELPYLCYRPLATGFMIDTGNEILPQEYRDRCGKDFILIYEFKGVNG
jgi:uncharacterized protein YycO